MSDDIIIGKISYAELYFVDKCFNNIDTLHQQCYSDWLISVKISLIGYIKINYTITSLFLAIRLVNSM